MKDKKIEELLKKVQKVSKENKIDLSSGEDLSIGVMNLISIEEHLFFTFNKTKDDKYIDLLNEVRLIRTELLRDIIKDYEGEVWCISKHLLASSMRLLEVGTKELKKGNKKKAKDLFEKAYKLYSMFWGINLKVVNIKEVQKDSDLNLISDKNNKVTKVSVFSKIGDIFQKALDCCKE
ncbi:hypothetical protein KJ570_02230 [Patescibacteria group bacterium]|nr:hypothetical protein [Patescibacteria group bacterium]